MADEKTDNKAKDNSESKNKLEGTSNKNDEKTLCKVSYIYDGKTSMIQSVIKGETISKAHAVEIIDDSSLYIEAKNELPSYTIEGSEKKFNDWWTRLQKGEDGQEREKAEKLENNKTIEEANVNVYPRLCINDREDYDNTVNHYGIEETTWNPVIGPYCPLRIGEEYYGKTSGLKEEVLKEYITKVPKTRDERLLKDADVKIKISTDNDRAEFSDDQCENILNENWMRHGSMATFESVAVVATDTKKYYYRKTEDVKDENGNIIGRRKKENFDKDKEKKERLESNIENAKKVKPEEYLITETEIKLKSRTVTIVKLKKYADKEGGATINTINGTINLSNLPDEPFNNIRVFKSDQEFDYAGQQLINEMKDIAGLPRPSNQAQVDHIHAAKYPGSKKGSNSYCNARLASQMQNASDGAKG